MQLKLELKSLFAVFHYGCWISAALYCTSFMLPHKYFQKCVCLFQWFLKQKKSLEKWNFA